MYNSQGYELNRLIYDEIIIYLRKSRQDDPNETVEEVLSRHEMQLQEFALRTWGAKIPESNIYREVVSGETIDDRPEIKKIIERVQGDRIKGVLVIEPQRLTRGDLLDLGTMVHSLRYTNTLCITPQRYFNLEDKYDRRAFEDELKRGNDYLEYTKEILARGRRASAMLGYWVHAFAPYGYDRVQLKNKKYTLEANDNAPTVRLIFEWFADGVSMLEIAKRLQKMGIKPTKKTTIKWSSTSVRNMLKNDAYIGIVRYGETKKIRVYVDGKLKRKQVPAPESEHIVAKGLHDPIIPLDLWERAQVVMGKHDRTNSDFQLVNPLAGLLVCKKCGFVMRRKSHRSGQEERYRCTMNPQCPAKSAYVGEVLNALQSSLRANVVEVEEKIASGAESSREARTAQLAALEEKMQRLQDQEDHQYDLLEKREYTPEVFNRRHTKLVKEMDSVRAAIEEARASIPEAIDYESALVRLHAAIDALDNKDMMPIEKNIILKAIIEKVEYNRDKGENNNPFELDVYLRL